MEYSNEQRTKIVQNMGLTVEAVFVPFSQSRNAKEKQPSLNWRVTVKRDGREILTTDYSAGGGHAPSYRPPTFRKRTIADQERETMVMWECEHGGKAQGVAHRSTGREAYGSQIGTLKPNPLDVLYSLVMDADVLDAGGFEAWASALGYDTDSRAAERLYQGGLEIALKLRAGLGDKGLQDLRDAFEDY